MAGVGIRGVFADAELSCLIGVGNVDIMSLLLLALFKMLLRLAGDSLSQTLSKKYTK